MNGSDYEPVDLRVRTKRYALRVIRLYAALPKETVPQVLGKQLLRAGTSVGAHYREAFRARSPREFTSILQGGLKELEESAYWLELIADAGLFPADRLAGLLDETNQLIAIFTASVKTAKRNDG